MMPNILRIFAVVLILAVQTARPVLAVEPGRVTGGIDFVTPDWFKTSFLEIASDVEEASESGKHVMLFFHLNGCPYCSITVNQQFQQEPLKSFMQQNFDSIEINVKGDREIALSEDVNMAEGALAEYLKIQATPTILLLDSDNRVVLRLNGYRSLPALQQAFNFVQQKAYLNESFGDYKHRNMNYGQYRFIQDPMIETLDDFSALNQPVALLFEDNDCNECATFHNKLINRKPIREQLAQYKFVRLDAKSEQPIKDFNGRSISPRDWVAELGLSYRPGVILFDEGREIARVESMLFPFHFEHFLRFGLNKNHEKYTRYGELMRARQEVLFAQGIDTDIGKPDDW